MWVPRALTRIWGRGTGFLYSSDSAWVGFRQWCPVKTRSTGKLDRISRRSWKCGLRRKNQCFLLWQSDLESGVQPISEVDWFFFFLHVYIRSSHHYQNPHAPIPMHKINQVICFIHGPIVSTAVLVPTLCISQGHAEMKHSSSSLSIQDEAKWISFSIDFCR